MIMGHGSTGQAIRNLPMEKRKPSRKLKVLLKALNRYLKQFKGLLLIAAFLSLIYATIEIVNRIILSIGIDNVDPANPTPFIFLGIELTDKVTIILFSLLFVIFGLLGFVLNSLSIRILSKVRALLVYQIRNDVYHYLINSSMQYIKNEQSGNITARITSDTDEVSTGIQIFITIIVQIFLLITSFIVIIIRTKWQISLICVASIPIALILSSILSIVGRRIVLNIRQVFGIVSGKMAENLSGIAISKSFNQEEHLSYQMRILNHQHYNFNKKFGLMMNFMMPLISTISSLVMTMILWLGGVIVNLSVGEIFLGTVLAAQFLQPVTNLSLSFPQLQAALGAMDRVLDVINATPSLPDDKNAIPLSEDYSVSFKNVYFAYEGKNWILKNINFKVSEGELIAIVGVTGAGKTTLASMLIPRFYDVQKGSIKIGNKDIRKLTQHSLRKAIGLIPQEPYLFTGTVLDNIRYGKPNATEEEISNICQLIGANSFIEALPEGYQTIIREGGKQLSAGQRQIITIARAMLADPKILILDEATSRLDAYSESLVQNAQRKLFKNRTTFVIAHRLSTIYDADKIIVFDHGELVEMGTHEDLLKNNGIYAKLYKTYYSFQGLESIDIESLKDLEEITELPSILAKSKNSN